MKKQWTPTTAQEKFVEHLLSGLSIKHAAEQAGCSRDAYYKTWRHNADFLAYLEEKRREAASGRLAKVDNALFVAAEEGDVSAMRLAYERWDGLRTGGSVQINNVQTPEGSEPGKKLLSMLDDIEAKRGLHLVTNEPVASSTAQPAPSTGTAEAR